MISREKNSAGPTCLAASIRMRLRSAPGHSGRVQRMLREMAISVLHHDNGRIHSTPMASARPPSDMMFERHVQVSTWG